MKFILIFLFSLSTLAGLPPTTLKSKDGVKATTFNYEVPYSQATKTSTGGLIETGNNNRLVNPSLEHSTYDTGLTISGSGVAKVVESTNVHSGSKSAKVTFTASTNGAIYWATSATSQDTAQQAQASLWVKNSTGVSGALVCPYVGAAISDACLDVKTDLNWNNYVIPFVMSATGSNGVVLKTTSSAITGDFYVDDAVVKSNDTAIVNSVDTEWVSYTPTTQGFTLSSGLQWKRQGSDVLIRGKVTVSSVNASEARIDLPSGLTSNTTLVTSIQSAGTFIMSVVGATAKKLLIESGATYMTIGGESATRAALTKVAGQDLLSGTDEISVDARIPITGWSSSSLYISASNQDTEWASYTPTLNGITVTTPVLYWKRVGGDMYIRGNLLYATSSANPLYFSLPNSKTINTSVSTSLKDNFGFMQRLATGVFVAGDAGNQFSLVYDSGNGAGNISVARIASGSSYVTVNGSSTGGLGDSLAINAVVPIQGWSTPSQVIATLKDVVTTPNTPNGRPVSFAANISTTGVVSSEFSDFISGNCTNASPSVCTFSYPWTVAPNCMSGGANNSSGYFCNAYGETTTTVTLTCTDTLGNTTLVVEKDIVCHGY